MRNIKTVDLHAAPALPDPDKFSKARRDYLEIFGNQWGGSKVMPGTCEACVYNSGAHFAGCAYFDRRAPIIKAQMERGEWPAPMSQVGVGGVDIAKRLLDALRTENYPRYVDAIQAARNAENERRAKELGYRDAKPATGEAILDALSDWA